MEVLAAKQFLLKSGATMTYRPFQPPDSRSCAALLSRNITRAFPLEEPKQKLYEKEMAAYTQANIVTTAYERNYHVAEVDGQAVGVIGIQRLPYAARRPSVIPAMEITDLMVERDLQGMNIGRILLSEGIVEKSRQGIQFFHALCPSTASNFFTNKIGFKELETGLESVRWGKVNALSFRVNSIDVESHSTFLKCVAAAPAFQ